jgi:hypothetical protein
MPAIVDRSSEGDGAAAHAVEVPPVEMKSA